MNQVAVDSGRQRFTSNSSRKDIGEVSLNGRQSPDNECDQWTVDVERRRVKRKREGGEAKEKEEEEGEEGEEKKGQSREV